jgi:hypothetical protein
VWNANPDTFTYSYIYAYPRANSNLHPNAYCYPDSET